MGDIFFIYHVYIGDTEECTARLLSVPKEGINREGARN